MDMFTEGKIGNNILKNRVIRSATNDHLGNIDGTISKEQVELYENLGKNNIGMIITGHFGVDADHRAAINQPLISDDRFIPGAAILAEAVHRFGGLICGQISHAGLKSVGSPFDINTVSEQEIMAVISAFAKAAKRLQHAGYDAVQIHLAHGYFLANVLDDTVNRRADSYGRCLSGRFSIIRNVLESVREECGEGFSVIVKLSVNNSALTEYDGALRFYAQELEKCGVDAIELSGWNFNSFPPEKDCYYLREAQMLRAYVGIPLIAVGGISDRAAIEKVLAAGIDFASCCRAFVSDPDFVTRLMNGSDRSRCKRCWRCRTLYKTEYRNCIFHDRSEALNSIFSPD